MTIIAAAHAASVYFDVQAGTAKAISLMQEAAAEGAELLVLPESFIPGFPIWNALLRPIDGHEFFTRFAAASLRVDGAEIGAIRSAAARLRIAVWLGFSEQAEYSQGCLWNSAVLITQGGQIAAHHRKLVPTFYEKLTWNRGDGAGLKVSNLPFGKVGGLICGENGNPLARYTLMAQGEEIHCSNYPSVWPFKDPRNAAPYDLGNAIRTRAAAHSFEAKTFTAVSAGFLDEGSIAAICGDDTEAAEILRASPKPSSLIVAPDGSMLGEALTEREGLVLAEVDVSQLVELKQHHDMAGYYNRHDIFQVSVARERQSPLVGSEPVGRPVVDVPNLPDKALSSTQAADVTA